jgi:hypothetical protein
MSNSLVHVTAEAALAECDPSLNFCIVPIFFVVAFTGKYHALKDGFESMGSWHGEWDVRCEAGGLIL